MAAQIKTRIDTRIHKPPMRRLAAVRAVIAALAIGLLAWGAAHGDCQTIFGKAIFVCLECIGIG